MKNKKTVSFQLVFGTVSFALIILFLSLMLLKGFERSVTDVYADAQDGCIQLILDRINLAEDESKEKIVSDILVTLGASSSGYRTVSADNTMVFIKDFREANLCKDFTADACFVSDSAREFINGLQVNRVVHSAIELEDIPYIASGAKLEYGGETYRICLLTATEIILDHNSFLSARINLFILLAVMIAAVAVGGLTVTILLQNRYNTLRQAADESRKLRRQIEGLTERFTRRELYSTKYMAFGESAVDMLIEKLEQRDVWPLTYIIVRCRSEEQRRLFMLDAQAFCGERFIRALAENNCILIFNVRSEETAVSVVQRAAAHSGAEIAGNIFIREKPDIPLGEVIRQYNSAVMTNESGERLLCSQNKLKEKLGVGETCLPR